MVLVKMQIASIHPRDSDSVDLGRGPCIAFQTSTWVIPTQMDSEQNSDKP